MSTHHDIPVARRISSRDGDRNTVGQRLSRFFRTVPWWGYGVAIAAFFAPLLGARFLPVELEAAREPKAIALTSASPIATPTAVPSPAASPAVSSPMAAEPDSILGHLAYDEAPAESLRAIARGGDGYEIRLRKSAAQAFEEMAAAARAEGVDLVVLSGFRTKGEQEQLFFDISKQRNQTPVERSAVSAPPGYSEHHTGYAVDIGDASVPSTNLSPEFERTPAFRWLEQNAAKFGFEMSFPRHNPQGVSYEPWHWRFVGDADSLATFYRNTPRTVAETSADAIPPAAPGRP